MSNIAQLKQKARSFEQREQWKSALEVYEQLVQEQPEGDDLEVGTWNRIGDLHMRIGQTERAVSAYERAVQAYADAGLHNNAIALCNKILRVTPGRTAIYLKLGLISALKGFVADARLHLGHFVERMRDAGQLEAALETLAKSIEGHAEDAAELRRAVAEQLRAHGREAEALPLFVAAHRALVERGLTVDAERVWAEIQEIDPRAASGTGAFAMPPASPAASGRSPAERLHVLDDSPDDVPDAAGPDLAGLEIAPLIDSADELGADDESTSISPLDGFEATSFELPDSGDTPDRRDSPDGSGDVGFDLDITVDDGAGPGDEPESSEDEALPLISFGAGDPEDEQADVDPGVGASTDGLLSFEVEVSADDLEETRLAGFETDDRAPAVPEPVGEDDEAGAPEFGVDLDDFDLSATPADEPLPMLGGAPTVELEDDRGAEDGADTEPELISGGEDDSFGIEIDVPAASAGWPDADGGDDAEEDDSAFADAPLPTFGDELAFESPAAAPAYEPVDGSADEQEDGPTDDALRDFVGEALDSAEPAALPASAVALVERLEAEPSDLEAARALTLLIEAGRADADAVDALHGALGSLAERADYMPALEVVRSLLQIRPGDTALYQKQVEIAFRSEDPAALVRGYLDLAEHLQGEGDASKVKAVYERVLELDPDNAAARRALGFPEAVPLAAPAEEGYVDLAALIFEDDVPAASTRFVVEAEEPTGDEDHDFAEILARFREQVAQNIADDDASSHYDLGVAFKEMGLLDEAIAEFQAALRAGSNPLATLEVLGECFVAKEQYAVGWRVLDRAIRLSGAPDADLVGVLYWMARCDEALARRDAAAECYERVIAVDIRFRDAAERLRALRGLPRSSSL